MFSIEAEDKATYGQGYYADKLNKFNQGYVHPYHTDANPLVFSHLGYMKVLFDVVGPEQVSPHYESLSRSRRGLFFSFAYISSIVAIARMGGWENNMWIRGLVFHHEFLIAMYVSHIEIRHFTFQMGPKFTNFYNAYVRYETQQLCQQWADVVEEAQMEHLVHTKEQMEYVRINKEFEFVKKRALVNFLSNSRLALEHHMHDRAVNMISSIQRFEAQNLKTIVNAIGDDSFAKVKSAITDAAQQADIQEAAFQSALDGIRQGSMTYNNDPLLPILRNEINSRTSAYQGLSAEEESKLLSLNADQKRIISENDRKAKNEFLGKVPNINNPGIKVHDKYKAHAAYVAASI